MTGLERAWRPARLHVVTGKGGTGKTTVAAALALALAGGGARVLLVETEGRQGIAQVFDTPPLPFEETSVALASDGGEVRALPIDPEEAVLEYLDIFYRLRRAGWALRRTGALDFATTIAPGVKDVLITGKVKELVDRMGEGRTHYDAVVMDAPPTGRITQFLTVTAEVAGLAGVGPIKSQSESVARVMRSEQTLVHVVSILEEMPVQETADAVAEMTDAGLHVGHILVNMVRPLHFPPERLTDAASGRLDAGAVAADLRRVGLPASPETVTALLDEARDHAQRLLQERELRERLHHIHRPTIELPLLTGPMDLSAVYGLATTLREAGVTTAARVVREGSTKPRGRRDGAS